VNESWTIRIATAAEEDFQRILEWTVEHFGRRQAKAYAVTVSQAIQALSQGPTTPRLKPRPDIFRDVAVLHVARGGRKGRHFIVVRLRNRAKLVEVLRILHDSMDLARHIEEE